MIPIEFFDWVKAQWWGLPSFGVLILITLFVGSCMLAAGTRR